MKLSTLFSSNSPVPGRSGLRQVLTLILSFSCFILSSQVPQGFNYQALASDVSGNPIKNTDLQVKISILSDTLPVVTVWEELHSVVKTNVNGMFSLVVGSGTRQTASSVSLFSDINWGTAPLYIKTQVYYKSAWKNMGSAKLWTVPYAMVSGGLSGNINKLAVTGQTAALDEALFEVKNKDGQIIFAVYNEGVRVYVDNGAKGAKGGFAIGGFGNAKAQSQEYFIVNADSIRAYIYDNPLVKSSKGGFAIGGFGNAKGITNDYMLISPDSARIYVNNAPSTKGAKGGFAIGGFDPAKGTVPQKLLTVSDDSTRIYVKDAIKGAKGGFAIGGFNPAKGSVTPFTSLTSDNYFIGHGSGMKNSTGLYNSFLGYETGLNNVAGNNNVFLGFSAGLNNDASNNVFIGYQSGYSNLSGGDNVFLGTQSGYTNTTGVYNTFLGYNAGYTNNASYNSFIGYQAGKANTSGQYNSFMGYNAGLANTTGASNVFIGNQAGYTNSTGSYNVMVGFKAGYVSTNTLTGFSYIYTSGPSVSQSFTVNGIYMSTGITVTPSVNYEVSTDNSSFSLSPIVIGAAGTINNTTIYVRLAAELSAANYNSQAITLSSTSATDKIVTCSGSVPTPTISTSVSSLNGLNYGFSYGPSASQSFTVTSSNLPNDVTVTAPTNFEVSLSAGGTYSSSVSVTKNNATVPVYVRLVSGLSLATYSGTNITVASTGVTTLDVAVSGTVGSPIIKVGVSAGTDLKTAVTLVAYTYSNGPSGALSGMFVSGDYLQSDVTATAPTNFEVSKNNSTFADFVTFTMSNQTVSGQLWVRLKAGLNTDTYSGNIVFSSTGAPNRIVIPTGFVTGGPQLTTGVLSSGSFNYAGNGPGTERTFALSGTNVASDVTITPSANFEVSLTTGSGFSSSPITALQAIVTAGTTIYVRMKAGIAPNTYNEAITISATSANTRTVSVSGTVSSLITLSATSNLNVDYAGNGPSTAFSFTVTGANMAGDITVTPPADYEVSTTSGSGYLLTPFTISPSSGAISQILYFRLKAGLAPAAYNSEIISLSAATAATKNFTCSGTVSPLLTTSVSTMTGFSAVFGAGTSSEQNFTVTGTNVTSDVTVTPPANYEISTSTGGSFAAQNPITILQANATTPTTIYVRLAAGLSVADYTGVNIVASATGASSKNVGLSGYVVAATGATDDYRSLASGNWSDNSTWESKAIGSTHWSAASLTPTSSATSVLIQNGHTITLTSPLTTGTLSINNGGTLAANATLTANGNVTLDGTFQLNAGGWATGSGTWTYSGGTLAFNNTSSYGVNSGDVFWPTTAGPTNINILQGGLTLNSGANRIVSGLFQTAAGVTLSGATLTLNGIAQIDAGGYFANAPTYGVSSTLKYNTGNTYGRGTEWVSPANVQLSNNSTLDYPNTGSGAFSTNLSISGNLTVDAGSALYMDYGGSGNKSGSLTVTGNVILNGALSLGNALGGDLYVGGNWTTPATNSSLNSNSRAVIFNGTSSQVINHASLDVFPYLIINNFTNGVSIANSLTATNLTIKPKAKLTLDAEKTLTSTSFTIESNATGTGTYIDNGTSTVTSSTVQNYLASARNWYLSSPVSGATTSAGNTYLKYVENGNNGTAWTPVNTGTIFTKMVGYIAQAPSANTISFTGTLNNGDQSITGLTSTGTAKVGFNLIGNPYPSYVNWDHAANTKTNVGASIWYRTKNNATTPVYVFDTYGASAGIGTNLNGLGDVTANIPPMQAFWVKVNAGQTGTVGFTNEARSHTDNALPNNKFRVSSANNTMQKVVRLQVSNGTNSDEAIVLFNPNALNELDDYDSQKMSNGNVAIPEIYTTIGAEKFVINGMNNFSLDQKIPLGFATGQLNLFTIKATQISNFDADTKIFLKDNLQNIEQELTIGSGYSFNSDVTSTENRFSLIFKSASATTDLKNWSNNFDQDIIVFKNADNHIMVQYVCNFYTGANVSVYNSTGQKLITQNLTSTVTDIDTPLSSGVYLVVVSNSVTHFTRKVTIN
jgi:hypothetical protein